MKAKIAIELPPGVVLTDSSRAALVSAVKHKLGCCGDHGGEQLEKAEPRRLPHAAPQAWIDETGRLYAEQMKLMLADIEKVLTDSTEQP